MVKVQLEFGGGMELLFDNQRVIQADVPFSKGDDGKLCQELTVRDTMRWMRDTLLKERPDMFMKGDTVRPGVLVLINDADWELSGLDDSIIEEGDVVTFISTLHGG